MEWTQPAEHRWTHKINDTLTLTIGDDQEWNSSVRTWDWWLSHTPTTHTHTIVNQGRGFATRDEAIADGLAAAQATSEPDECEGIPYDRDAFIAHFMEHGRNIGKAWLRAHRESPEDYPVMDLPECAGEDIGRGIGDDPAFLDFGEDIADAWGLAPIPAYGDQPHGYARVCDYAISIAEDGVAEVFRSVGIDMDTIYALGDDTDPEAVHARIMALTGMEHEDEIDEGTSLHRASRHP